MPNVKISALPAATDIASTQVLPMVIGGVTSKVTKEDLFKVATGDDLYLDDGGDGHIGLSGTGFANIFGLQGVHVQSTTMPSTDGLVMDNVGHVSLSSVAGQSLWLNVTSGAPVTIGDGSGYVTIQGVGVSVAYNASAPANWATSSPTTVHDALDRIAAAVAGLLGTPIP